MQERLRARWQARDELPPSVIGLLRGDELGWNLDHAALYQANQTGVDPTGRISRRRTSTRRAASDALVAQARTNEGAFDAEGHRMVRMPSRRVALGAGARGPIELPDVNFAALRCFYAVARAGSISGAVPVLRMRQPGISKAIQALERDLGARLLDRRPRGVEVTAAGASVLLACERMFDTVAELRHATRAPNGPAGEVSVGASDHVATYLVAEVIARLRRSSPGLVARISTGAAHLLLPGITEGRPEIGLFFSVPPLPVVDRVVIARAPCQIVVRRESARDETVLRSFIGSREVDDPAVAAFPTLDMLRRKRLGTSIVVSSSGLEAHKELVRRGVGVAILPRFMIERELASREFALVEPSWVYEAALEVVSARGRRLSANASALIAELKKTLRARGLRPDIS
jgi:DNA-binding transcriptional LysR family regulator